MINFYRPFLVSVLVLIPLLGQAEEDHLLYGCYFSQSREVGEWVTTTSALLIEKAEEGILVHGSVSSWQNSWISTLDNQTPVPLKKSANRKFLYEGELHPDKPYARCELVLRYDKENISITKHAKGCKDKWYTGDGIGPSEMSFASKQPSQDMCLGYLGIIRDSEAKESE